jgi:hypothetical protein
MTSPKKAFAIRADRDDGRAHSWFGHIFAAANLQYRDGPSCAIIAWCIAAAVSTPWLEGFGFSRSTSRTLTLVSAHAYRPIWQFQARSPKAKGRLIQYVRREICGF